MLVNNGKRIIKTKVARFEEVRKAGLTWENHNVTEFDLSDNKNGFDDIQTLLSKLNEVVEKK